MATHNLVRWGGLISIIAALVGITQAVLALSGALESMRAVTTSTAVTALFYVLMLFAVWAVYAAQAQQSNRLGRLAYVLAIVGAIIHIVYFSFATAEILGVVALREVFSFFYFTIPVFVVGSPVLNVGLFLLGIATLRTSVLPRWAGLVLAVGAVLTLAGDLAFVPNISLLGLPPRLSSLASRWPGWAGRFWKEKAGWLGKRGLRCS